MVSWLDLYPNSSDAEVLRDGFTYGFVKPFVLHQKIQAEVNTCLPMGCSIYCNFFKMFSSFLEWVVRFETGSCSIIHYLDDFLFVSPGPVRNCRFLLDSFRYFMSRFGVPLSSEKTEGPKTTVSFLGIEMNSLFMGFR